MELLKPIWFTKSSNVANDIKATSISFGWALNLNIFVVTTANKVFSSIVDHSLFRIVE